MSSLLGWVKKRKEDAKSKRQKSPVALPRHPADCWINKFLRAEENRCFCKIDKDFLEDTFSHYGLNRKIKNYKEVIEVMLDQNDCEAELAAKTSDLRSLKRRTAQLYGLLHARYILTCGGLQKMGRMYKKSHWGSCPRVGCHSQPLLPVGIYDEPHREGVKLYCCRCGLLYRSNAVHSKIDGCFFGTSFPHLFFMTFPEALAPKSKLEFLVPTVYGFKLHRTWKKASSKGYIPTKSRSI